MQDYVNVRIRKTTHVLAKKIAEKTNKKLIDVIDEAVQLLKFYYVLLDFYGEKRDEEA